MNERKVLLILIAIFAAIMTVILCSIACNYGLAEDYYVLCKPGDRVNVRSKPSMASQVTAWVEFGQHVTADIEKNGFMHVDGLASEVPEGWICSGYLAEEEPRADKHRAEVWEGDVIARKWINGRRVCKLREGRIVIVYAQTNKWAVTSKGYIMCDWLREVDE